MIGSLDTKASRKRVHSAMQVRVSGKHVDVGDALRARIDEELTAGIGKYFERGGDSEVVVSRDGHGFRADCTVIAGVRSETCKAMDSVVTPTRHSATP